MAVQRYRDRELSCAAGQLQHRTSLLPGEVRIKRQVRADRQERVVEVRVIVEIRGQNGLRKRSNDPPAILTQIQN